MQLMLTSMANISVQTSIWNPDQTAPRRSGSTLIATKTSFDDAIWVVMLGKCSLRQSLWLISPYRQTLWTWIRLLLGEQFNLGPNCLLQRLAWNKLAEDKWRFAGVTMMAQHCWLSSFAIFQGILTSIASKHWFEVFSGPP